MIIITFQKFCTFNLKKKLCIVPILKNTVNYRKLPKITVKLNIVASCVILKLFCIAMWKQYLITKINMALKFLGYPLV